MAKHCRCCLSSTDAQQLLPLFEDNRDDLYRKCTELLASEDDLLSKWICPACFSKCNKWKEQQTEHIERQNSFYDIFSLLTPAQLPKEKKILYSCDKCDKKYKQEHQLELHIQMDHIEQDNLSCKMCLLTFSSIFAHKMHYTHMHLKREKPKRIFKCDQCDSTFTLLGAMRVHKQMHVTPNAFVCETCGKFFPHNRGLQKHLSAHSTDRPYKCTICEMSYKSNAGLLHHIYVHKPEAMPHVCTECDKRFSKRTALKIHIANKHSSSRPFKCKYCTKSFAHAQGLTKHERLHQMDGGPFKCDYCNQILKNKTTLKSHMERHNPNPNPKHTFSCEFCGRTGTNKIAMQQHRMTHTGERPHQCTLCDTKFIQKSALNFHMRTQHKQKEENKTE